ncbi:hypothetical protein H6S82_12540 [Planktothrix sp. FACHB-1355]|uniref:YbjN domain-containing protein n=1 Tax=Aerosakkonema funiforme FACHB-1375 TaxID=2949571 RepID=A0A926VCJ2_9CYAN|nr:MULTISPECIES: hypothetical protein [Oscillatoriales]MBD2181065.1 hypothetical protein [Aerosakkonema funiforme FACHB-1375]MBD3559685.1 hypothetical protein [Planktothrix sp. FACHB-1355]
MATTLPQIAHYLDERGWKYKLDEENNCIITGVKAKNVENFWLVINLMENGEYFQMVAPQLLTGVKDHVYKGVLFQTLLALSWETKMVRWEYNQLDGEVRASIEFPLEDGGLTQRQFDRCLNMLIQLVDELAMPRLKTVLETGEDPNQKELGERLLLSLQEILPDGSLGLLEQAIAARKQRGIS